MNKRKVVGISAITVVLLALAITVYHGCGAVRRPDGGVGLLSERAMAPDFSALDQNGQRRSLSEFRGRFVVLYFYPRDGTPGCTREACAFRDAWDQYSTAGITVLGVSSDDVASHARFAREHQLQFPLLSDTNTEIANRYGVGRFLSYYARVTYIIDPNGAVNKVFPNVDPAVHSDQVLRQIEQSRPPQSSTTTTTH